MTKKQKTENNRIIKSHNEFSKVAASILQFAEQCSFIP